MQSKPWALTQFEGGNKASLEGQGMGTGQWMDVRPIFDLPLSPALESRTSDN
jgi:hypothetical protein